MVAGQRGQQLASKLLTDRLSEAQRGRDVLLPVRVSAVLGELRQ
jgi:hypothetical protein